MCCIVICGSLSAGDGQVDILPNGSETFTISKSGSYILTSDVTMTADVNCIDITAGNVILDLNGHAITGLGSGSGTAAGVYAAGQSGICIRNGAVCSFGGDGINTGNRSHIIDVFLDKNGGDGLEAGSHCCIEGVKATYNVANGISALQSSMVKNCIANNNGSIGDASGIDVRDGSTVKGCIANDNDYRGSEFKYICGVRTQHDCTIIGNTCYGNYNKTTIEGGAVHGIKAGNGCTIINNNSSCNKGSDNRTAAYGIMTGFGCTITGNTCHNNQVFGEGADVYGLYAGENCLISDNTCYKNESDADQSTGYGIYTVGSCCVVRGNNCNENNGVQNGYGIRVKAGSTRVEGNSCAYHNPGAGIDIDDHVSKCIVIRNNTEGNEDGVCMGNDANYCAENMCTDGVVDTTGVTVGTGDRSNVSF